ncbi:hypothetical protein EJB05_26115, partial [Eragrostis curvula]
LTARIVLAGPPPAPSARRGTSRIALHLLSATSRSPAPATAWLRVPSPTPSSPSLSLPPRADLGVGKDGSGGGASSPAKMLDLEELSSATNGFSRRISHSFRRPNGGRDAGRASHQRVDSGEWRGTAARRRRRGVNQPPARGFRLAACRSYAEAAVQGESGTSARRWCGSVSTSALRVFPRLTRTNYIFKEEIKERRKTDDEENCTVYATCQWSWIELGESKS